MSEFKPLFVAIKLQPARYWRRRAARAVARGDEHDARLCMMAADSSEYRMQLKQSRKQNKGEHNDSE